MKHPCYRSFPHSSITVTTDDFRAIVAEHALSHKVVVRPFAGEGTRVTIGTAEENDVFLAAARSWLT